MFYVVVSPVADIKSFANVLSTWNFFRIFSTGFALKLKFVHESSVLRKKLWQKSIAWLSASLFIGIFVLAILAFVSFVNFTCRGSVLPVLSLFLWSFDITPREFPAQLSDHICDHYLNIPTVASQDFTGVFSVWFRNCLWNTAKMLIYVKTWRNQKTCLVLVLPDVYALKSRSNW